MQGIIGKCLRVREIKRNKEPGGITSIE